MAALSNQYSPQLDSYLFDIFKDGSGPARNASPSQILGGPCNYGGPEGVRCGCRRFWQRGFESISGSAYTSSEHSALCMCGHHACFHDDGTLPQQAVMLPVVTQGEAIGQENERPRSLRGPLSPVHPPEQLALPSNFGQAALEVPNLHEANSAYSIGRVAPSRSTLARSSAGDDSMPDTLPWDNVAPSQAGHRSSMHDSPQGLIRSQTASTASSSQIRFLKPFAGRGLHSLTQYRSESLRGTLHRGPTVVSSQATPTMDVQPERNTTTSRAPSVRSMDMQPQSSLPEDTRRVLIRNLSHTIDVHAHRLDRLENTSFSTSGHDECYEKHDNSDIRIADLESRMDDVEKKLNDDTASIATTSRFSQNELVTSTPKATSLSSQGDNMSLSSDVLSQLHTLQARVSHLESMSLPSFSTPWELEVVLLPFPLPGIWMTWEDFPAQRRSSAPEGSSQMQNSQARTMPMPSSTLGNDWVDRDSGWLLPKVFAPGRDIDQRLRSRGLIQNIRIRGSDARSVHAGISNAFDKILGTATRWSAHPAAPSTGRLMGLQQSWVPLRKMHKDSRLRFLSPAELVTPALWDVTFLKDSVVMRATGLHRLYITQPEAYLQDQLDTSSMLQVPTWSWQKLREMDRVYTCSQSSADSAAEVPEADALEECWAWNARLDDASAALVSANLVHESVEKHTATSKISSHSSEEYHTGVSRLGSSPSPIMARVHSQLSDRRQPRVARLPLERPTSVPPYIEKATSSPGISKRRAHSGGMPGSSGSQRHTSPMVVSRGACRTVNTVMASRSRAGQRTARSQSIRSAAYPTPRFSSTSFSRSPSLVPAVHMPGGAFEHRSDRRPSPYAYLTPHSNVPLSAHEVALRPDTRAVEIWEDAEMKELQSDPGSHTDGDQDNSMDDDYDPEAHALDDEDDDAENDDPVNRIDEQQENIQTRLSQAEHRSANHIPSAQRTIPALDDDQWLGWEDSENVDPEVIQIDDSDEEGDQGMIQRSSSEDSSNPSEYPSTREAWARAEDQDMRAVTAEPDDAIRIHEDTDDDDDQNIRGAAHIRRSSRY